MRGREVIAPAWSDDSAFDESAASYGSPHGLRLLPGSMAIRLDRANNGSYCGISLKGRAFIELCAQRGFRCIFLPQHHPGIMVGAKYEAGGIPKDAGQDGGLSRPARRAQAHPHYRRQVQALRAITHCWGIWSTLLEVAQ